MMLSIQRADVARVAYFCHANENPNPNLIGFPAVLFQSVPLAAENVLPSFCTIHVLLLHVIDDYIVGSTIRKKRSLFFPPLDGVRV